MAELEGAEAGLAFATGMAAIHAAIVSVVRAGQTIVATQAVYGTTRDLLVRILAGLGIATEFVDPTDLAAVDAALAATGAPVLYVETVSNPTIVVSDIAALAEVAHRRGARLLLVDNTFASPYACRPIEHGRGPRHALGHQVPLRPRDVLAGIVVGSRARIDAVRPILVDAGGALAPLAAFLVLRGLPTLALRMERHSATALAAGDVAVGAGRRGCASTTRACRTIPATPSPRGSWTSSAGCWPSSWPAAARRAGPSWTRCAWPSARPRWARCGRSSATRRPPLTASWTRPRCEAAGIAPGLLRCSVGLEDVDDLRADFELGLARPRRGRRGPRRGEAGAAPPPMAAPPGQCGPAPRKERSPSGRRPEGLLCEWL